MLFFYAFIPAHTATFCKDSNVTIAIESLKY